MKLRPVVDGDGLLVAYAFMCTGCDHAHVFYVSGAMVWGFDGNMTSPTFTPSLCNTCAHHPDPKQRSCHLNLIAGKLHYHADCTHDLASKIVDLLDWPWPQ